MVPDDPAPGIKGQLLLDLLIYVNELVTGVELINILKVPPASFINSNTCLKKYFDIYRA